MNWRLETGNLKQSYHWWELVRHTVPTRQNVTKCIVVGDAIVRYVGAEHSDIMVECYPGIKTEQLHSVRKDGSRQSRNLLSTWVLMT
jgi:hypothetical protein